MMKKATSLKQGDRFLLGGVPTVLAYRTEADSYGVVRLVLASGHSVNVSWDCRFKVIEAPSQKRG